MNACLSLQKVALGCGRAQGIRFIHTVQSIRGTSGRQAAALRRLVRSLAEPWTLRPGGLRVQPEGSLHWDKSGFCCPVPMFLEVELYCVRMLEGRLVRGLMVDR